MGLLDKIKEVVSKGELPFASSEKLNEIASNLEKQISEVKQTVGKTINDIIDSTSSSPQNPTFSTFRTVTDLLGEERKKVNPDKDEEKLEESGAIKVKKGKKQNESYLFSQRKKDSEVIKSYGFEPLNRQLTPLPFKQELDMIKSIRLDEWELTISKQKIIKDILYYEVLVPSRKAFVKDVKCKLSIYIEGLCLDYHGRLYLLPFDASTDCKIRRRCIRLCEMGYTDYSELMSYCEDDLFSIKYYYGFSQTEETFGCNILTGKGKVDKRYKHKRYTIGTVRWHSLYKEEGYDYTLSLPNKMTVILDHRLAKESVYDFFKIIQKNNNINVLPLDECVLKPQLPKVAELFTEENKKQLAGFSSQDYNTRMQRQEFLSNIVQQREKELEADE